MNDTTDDALRKGLACGAVGFGALATLAPRLFEAMYGVADRTDLRTMTRLWGTRTTLLGLALLGADVNEGRRLTQLATAMNVADALIVAGAGPEVNKRARVLGSFTSASFAAGFGWLLRPR